MGGDVVSYRLRPGAAAAGHLVRELGLPREALVNVIVRDGHAIPPRGSTEVREGDELHILVRSELRAEVEELTRRWHEGPIGAPPPPRLPRRGSPQIFSVGPGGEIEDPSAPIEVNGIAVVSVLRSRRDSSSALVALVDGRYALTSEAAVAVGDRRAVARWCERRAQRIGSDDPAEQAWWQEVIGALIAR
jgi:cell volume regulation protein A